MPRSETLSCPTASLPHPELVEGEGTKSLPHPRIKSGAGSEGLPEAIVSKDAQRIPADVPPAVQAFNVRRSPLSRTQTLTLPEGANLAEMVARALPEHHLASKAKVTINGLEINPAVWRHVRSKPGTLVEIGVNTIHGGGNKIIRSLLMIAVVTLAVFTGGALTAFLGAVGGGILGTAAGAAIAGGALTAGLGVLGTLAVTALVPPSSPTLGLGAPDPLYQIEGARNQARPGRRPQVLVGERRIAPEIYGLATEELGGDIYLRMVLCWTIGKIALRNVQIGETAITNFNEVEIEHRLLPTDPPLTLFSNDPFQESVGTILTAGTWVSRTTQIDTEEVVVLLSFERGLVSFDKKNRPQSRTVLINYRYRRVGDTIWENALATVPDANASSLAAGAPDRGDYFNLGLGITPWIGGLPGEPGSPPPGTPANGSVTYTEARPGPFIRSFRFALPKGQYEIEVQRVTADTPAGDQKNFDEVKWQAITSIARTNVVTDPNAAVTAIRIKATGNLNNIIDTVNGVASRLCPVLSAAKQTAILADPVNFDYASLTGADWSDEAETTYPADNLLFMMQGPQSNTPYPDANVDWGDLGRFWEWCQSKGWRCSGYIPGETRRAEAMAMIAEAGRGRPLTRGDGRLGVVIDRPGQSPVQLFTAQNVRGFRWSRIYSQPVHGLRTKFPDRNNGWRETERIAYADGFTAANAQFISDLPQPLQDDCDLVWQHGRFAWATATLQPEVFTWQSNWESITSELGDLIEFQHPVMLKGVGPAALVTARVLDGSGNVTAVDVSEVLPMEAGKSYALRFRRNFGTTPDAGFEVVGDVPVQTVAGENTRLTFVTSILAANEVDAPDVDDLIAFGEAGIVTDQGLITNIRKLDNREAAFTCVAAAAPRHTSDTGTIPAFNPGITLPAYSSPPQVVFGTAVPGENGMIIPFSIPAGTGSGIASFRPRYRIHADDGTLGSWKDLPDVDSTETVVNIALLPAGIIIDVEVTTIATTGARSQPSIAAGIIVPPVDTPSSLDWTLTPVFDADPTKTGIHVVGDTPSTINRILRVEKSVDGGVTWLLDRDIELDNPIDLIVPVAGAGKAVKIGLTYFNAFGSKGTRFISAQTTSALSAPTGLAAAPTRIQEATGRDFGLDVTAADPADWRAETFEVEVQSTLSGLWDKPGGKSTAETRRVLTPKIGSNLTVDVRARFSQKDGTPGPWTTLTAASQFPDFESDGALFFIQATAPVNPLVGWIWADSTNNFKQFKWSGTAWDLWFDPNAKLDKIPASLLAPIATNLTSQAIIRRAGAGLDKFGVPITGAITSIDNKFSLFPPASTEVHALALELEVTLNDQTTESFFAPAGAPSISDTVDVTSQNNSSIFSARTRFVGVGGVNSVWVSLFINNLSGITSQADGVPLSIAADVSVEGAGTGDTMIWQSGWWKTTKYSFTNLSNVPTTLAGYGITDADTAAQVDQKIAALVASSPAALDTLNELATALGNDPNFATTITNLLAAKLNLAGGTMTGKLINTAVVAFRFGPAGSEWEIGVSGSDAYIRDVHSAGSPIPFIIRSGAPATTLDLQADGNVSGAGAFI